MSALRAEAELWQTLNAGVYANLTLSGWPPEGSATAHLTLRGWASLAADDSFMELRATHATRSEALAVRLEGAE